MPHQPFAFQYRDVRAVATDRRIRYPASRASGINNRPNRRPDDMLTLPIVGPRRVQRRDQLMPRRRGQRRVRRRSPAGVRARRVGDAFNPAEPLQPTHDRATTFTAFSVDGTNRIGSHGRGSPVATVPPADCRFRYPRRLRVPYQRGFAGPRDREPSGAADGIASPAIGRAGEPESRRTLGNRRRSPPVESEPNPPRSFPNQRASVHHARF